MLLPRSILILHILPALAAPSISNLESYTTITQTRHGKTETIPATTRTITATTTTATYINTPVKPRDQCLWAVIKTAPDSCRGYAVEEYALVNCNTVEDMKTFGNVGSTFQMLNGDGQECTFWEEDDCGLSKESRKVSVKNPGLDKWTEEWSYKSFRC